MCRVAVLAPMAWLPLAKEATLSLQSASLVPQAATNALVDPPYSVYLVTKGTIYPRQVSQSLMDTAY